MRKVSIKALYKNLSKELTNLPFKIEKNGVVFAVVLGQGLDSTEGFSQGPKEKSRPLMGYSKERQTGRKKKVKK